MHSASLLIAALILLRRPCTRNRVAASLLLARAARDTALSPTEREACLNLADDLEHDALSAPMAQEETTRRRVPRRYNAKSFNRAPAF